jgi:hypothetical protein
LDLAAATPLGDASTLSHPGSLGESPERPSVPGGRQAEVTCTKTSHTNADAPTTPVFGMQGIPVSLRVNDQEVFTGTVEVNNENVEWWRLLSIAPHEQDKVPLEHLRQ